ncbi:MAG TPA: HD domain-containing phosphohydrolase [Vicinamibacterales bacterium]|nr:HD domain-containing phosphohydrolase [Vicinamibacterales bacterium]
MSEEPASLSGSAAVCVYAVILAGAGVLAHSTWHLFVHPADPRWLTLAVLTVATGWITLRIPAVQISFSISDTFNIAAAVLFGPSAGAVTAALDGLVLSSQFTFSRRTSYRVLFNIAVSAIAIWLAARVFLLLAGNQPLLRGPFAAVRLVALLAVFAAVNYLVNTGLVAMAVSLERRLPAVALWRDHFMGLWVTHFGGVLAVAPLLLLRRLQGSIGVLDLLVLLVPLPAILYTTFRHAVGRVQDHVMHLGQVNRVYVAVIEALAQAVDAKDEVTHDHVRRVQMQAVRLAHVLGIEDEDQLQAIMAASLLHDVGKLAVPEHILNKPGRLTPSEYEVMKRHAPAGADILSVVGFPYPVVPIVRHHHENWDGTGYPDGLSGEQIPIGARILAVVDCFDALTSHRPYRPRLDDRAALQIIVERRGTMYDPGVVDMFLEMHDAGAVEVPPSVSPAETSASTRWGASDTAADRELRDLEAFCDLGSKLATSSRPEHVGESLWTHLRGRIPASTLVLYAYDQTDDGLVECFTAGDEHAGLRGARIPMGERLSGWVAATREPIMNSDARLDLDEAERESSALQSALAVPVTADGRLFGVVTFYSTTPDAFDEQHRRLAQGAAYAVARTRVFRAVARTRQTDRLRAETVQ